MDLGSALLGLLVALVFKVAVMFLGARLLLRVYRATAAEPPRRLWLLLPRENLPEVRVLWWSLVLFCLSEFTCGIEIYILLSSHPILTGVHAVVSGAGMALFALGVYMFLDREVIRYGKPTCVASRICRGCTIQETEGCKFLRVLLFAGTFVALAAVPPLLTPVEPIAVEPGRYVLPFESLNAWYDNVAIPWLSAHVPGYNPSGVAYTLPESMSVIEFRIEPAIAAGLAVAGIVALRRRRESSGVKLVVAAIGLLCYSYFELVLYRTGSDALIGSLGHEVGELWFLMATAEFLRRAFDPAHRAAAGTTEEGATAG